MCNVIKGYLLALFIVISILILSGCAGSPAPQEVAAESIGLVNQSSNVVTYEMEPWILGVVILLAGWAIPDPFKMTRGIISFIASLVGIFKK